MIMLLNFIKKHWELEIGTLCLLVGIGSYLYKSRISVNEIQQVENSYLAQIAQINNLREQETKEHLKNLETLQTQLNEIQTKYESAKKSLEQNKISRTSSIIKETENDPKKLAELLSKATGIPIKE